MQWSDIKNIVGKAAPLLGATIAGPAGSIVGSLVASAFGVENKPDAISKAIAADPEAAVKLRQIESDHKTQLERIAMQGAANTLQAETVRIESVNATMRTEINSETWYQRGWRPFWGFITAIAFFVVCAFICYLAYTAITSKDMTAITMIPQLVTSITFLFGIPGAILGVSAWHRGQQKREQLKLKASGE